MLTRVNNTGLIWINTLFNLSSANCHRPWGWPADERAAVLRSLHIRGHSDSRPRLSGRPNLARPIAQQRRDARGRVRGVSQVVERHAVCVLHPGGSAWVHRWVSANWSRYSRHVEWLFTVRLGYLCFIKHIDLLGNVLEMDWTGPVAWLSHCLDSTDALISWTSATIFLRCRNMTAKMRSSRVWWVFPQWEVFI